MVELGSATRSLFHSEHKGIVLGVLLLVLLCAVGAAVVNGFSSVNNLRSIFVLAAFLGIASLGQTLVALVGALDLSIPFVIGAANILLAFLFATGLSPALCIVIIALVGAAVGALNGLLSFRVQGQSLIVTLGVGFAVAGGAQIVTTVGSQYSGSVFTEIPRWLAALSSVNGTTFGIGFPPLVVIWSILALVVAVVLRRTRVGREIYAVGGNRNAAARLAISEFKVWMLTHSVSGLMASLAGILLLGFSGGGFVGVGDPYLFTTVAAVVIGGTSLLGGSGGYAATVVGALVMQTLTSLLVGLGLNFAAQQTVFGLMILPMVALYARAPHIRFQV